ncbi:MAG: hypothetical protein AAGB97_09095 [Dehalococcoidia bacterium]|nr:hypothetical protein [Chloroflexota bacterium]MBT9163055.1 hypothetical protein [Chloroflexota bacterium]
MEALVSFLPYYTRYILPGLTFVTFLVFVPILVLNPDILIDWGTGEMALMAVVVVLVSGYLLDVAGAYRWWNRAYSKATEHYLKEVAQVIYPSDSIKDENDARLKAQVVLARLWARCPEDYHNLIEEPRAKWVLTLQSAFLAKLSSVLWCIVILVQTVFYVTEISSTPWWRFVIGVALMGGFLWLGNQLSKRALEFARLSDTTAITLLNDRKSLLLESYRSQLH